MRINKKVKDMYESGGKGKGKKGRQPDAGGKKISVKARTLGDLTRFFGVQPKLKKK